MRLRITPAEGDPFDYVLDRESVTVGRSSTADLALQDPFLSRHHARLSKRDDQLLVEDLGSRNGTFVNDAPVQGLTPVKPGDVIRLSASSISLASDRATISTATTHDSGIGATIFRRATELLGEEISSSTERLDSAEALRGYAQRLETLRDVHEAVAGSLSEDALLAMILDRIFEHLKPQQGVIYLKESDGEYYQAAARALPGQSTDIPLSRTLVHEVLDKGMAALVFDAATDQRFAASESIMMSGIRSMVAAPLLADDKPIGMIVLNSKVAVKQFVEQDMELLASLASVASLKLRNIELLERDAQRRQMEAELALARRIQVSLLPEKLPTFGGWSILGQNFPSRGVSGDYYVVVPRKDDAECVLFMADVSGKGIAASIVTASLEALAAAPIESGAAPDEICDQLCRRLYKRTPPEKYATAFCAVLEPATGRLTYTNAGHNTALLVHVDGRIEDLTTCGLPIALLPEATYERREVQLEPGAGLLIYTDGITEAENKAGDEYGLDRLRDCYGRHFRLPIADLAEAIQNEVGEFVGEVPFADDRTLLLVQRASGDGKPPGAGS